MNRTSAVLGAALAVSLILNVVAFRRIRDEAPPSAKAGGPAEPKGPAAGGEIDGLRRALDQERMQIGALQDKIRRLEADREVLAQAATSGAPSPAAAPAKAPAADLRAKLRRMKKLAKAGEEGKQPDQETVLEMSGEIMEIMRLGLSRAKEPKVYADFLHAATEVGLEDEAALTPDQSAALLQVFGEMAGDLSRISADSAGERLVRELEIESAAIGRVQSLLSARQKEALAKSQMDDLPSMSTGMTTTFLQKSNGVDTVVKSWSSTYKLQDAQLPAARVAAEQLVQELRRIDASDPRAPGDFGSKGYPSRIAGLRAQLAALKSLEGALSAEQLDRLRSQSMREFQILEMAPPAELTEKK